jgi:hypothetical protein
LNNSTNNNLKLTRISTFVLPHKQCQSFHCKVKFENILPSINNMLSYLYLCSHLGLNNFKGHEIKVQVDEQESSSKEKIFKDNK